jgi:hypothetical protein
MNDAAIKELHTLLKSRISGIKSVVEQDGFILVTTKSLRATKQAAMDMLLSRAFKSVVCTEDNINGGYVVNARL